MENDKDKESLEWLKRIGIRTRGDERGPIIVARTTEFDIRTAPYYTTPKFVVCYLAAIRPAGAPIPKAERERMALEYVAPRGGRIVAEYTQDFLTPGCRAKTFTRAFTRALRSRADLLLPAACMGEPSPLRLPNGKPLRDSVVFLRHHNDSEPEEIVEPALKRLEHGRGNRNYDSASRDSLRRANIAIFSMFVKPLWEAQWTSRKIATALNQSGFTTPRGRRWTHALVEVTISKAGWKRTPP